MCSKLVNGAQRLWIERWFSQSISSDLQVPFGPALAAGGFPFSLSFLCPQKPLIILYGLAAIADTILP